MVKKIKNKNKNKCIFVIILFIINIFNCNIFALDLKNKWKPDELFKEVFNITKKIEGENKDYLLVDLGQVYIKLNMLNKCMSMIKTIKDPSKKVLLLCELSEKYNQLGNKKESILCLTKAVNTILEQIYITSQVDELIKLAVIYSTIGEKSESLELLTKIYKILDIVEEYDHLIAFKILNIAQEFIKNKQIEIAKEILNKKIILNIPFGGYYTSEGKAKIADLYSQIGEKGKTQNLLKEIIAYLSKEEVCYDKLMTLSDISTIFYRIGDKKKAMDLLSYTTIAAKNHIFNEAVSFGNRNSIYMNIGKKYIGIKEHRKVLLLLNLINYDPFKKELISKLISDYENISGDFLNVLLISSRKITSPEEKAESLMEIFNICNTNDKNKKNIILSEALNESFKIKHKYNKDFQLSSIANEYINIGNINKSLEILKVISEKAAKNNIYRSLAVYYIKNNDKEKSNDSLNNITDSRTKDFALQDISLIYFEKGLIKESINAINSILDPVLKGEGFLNLIK